MLNNKTIGVVVPAYNEALFIEEVIRTMPGFVDRIYAVNDASDDDTVKILENIDDNRLEIINHNKRKGAGAAMISGYKKALEEKTEIIAIMAGDGQMDPAILDSIIEPILQNRADYTKGDRLSIASHRQSMPYLRLIGNCLLTRIIRVTSGYYHICDPLNGYCAISGGILAKMDLGKIEPGYAFETDLIFKLANVNASVVNVSMPARYRSEKSKLGYIRFSLYTSWVIIRDYIGRLMKLQRQRSQTRFDKADVRESESC